MKTKILAIIFVIFLAMSFFSKTFSQEKEKKEPAIKKSKAFCLATIIYGLNLANPNKETWNLTNDNQKKFFKTYKLKISSINSLLDYLKGSVGTPAEVNKFFRENGFPNMNLTGEGKAIGTIFKLTVDWPVPGEIKKIYCKNCSPEKKFITGVKMTTQKNKIKILTQENDTTPLIQIKTNQGWTVLLREVGPNLLQFADSEADSKLAEITKVMINDSWWTESTEIKEIIFPLSKFEKEIDVSFLQGMNISTFSIDEIKNIIRLSLDDKGSRVESALAMLTRSASMDEWVIDNPFLAIYWREEDQTYPPFVALIAEDAWEIWNEEKYKESVAK